MPSRLMKCQVVRYMNLGNEDAGRSERVKCFHTMMPPSKGGGMERKMSKDIKNTVKNGEKWLDTDGNVLHAHGGYIEYSRKAGKWNGKRQMMR